MAFEVKVDGKKVATFASFADAKAFAHSKSKYGAETAIADTTPAAKAEEKADDKAEKKPS